MHTRCCFLGEFPIVLYIPKKRPISFAKTAYTKFAIDISRL